MNVTAVWTDEVLQEIFRHTPVGVALTDLHGTVLDANAALTSMIGYPRELLIGRPATSFLHADDLEKASIVLGGLRDAERVNKRGIHRLQARNGKTIWVNTTASVVRSRDEQICCIAFIEEIGDRLAMEKALRDSEALYRQVVEQQTEMIVLTDPRGTRTFANRAYVHYFGLRDEDIVGTTFLPLVLEEDRPLVAANLGALTSAQPVQKLRYRVVAAGGSVRWTEWTNCGTFDADGKLVTVQSIGRDVNDSVEAIDSIRASEFRYRRLLSEMPIAVWETDWSGTVAFTRRHGINSPDAVLDTVARNPEIVKQATGRLRIVEVNDAALQLAGVATREAFQDWIRVGYAPSSIEALIRGVAPVITGAAQISRAELQLVTATGETRDVIIQWGRGGRKSDWRVINTALDVTDRKMFERELARQQKNLEDAEAIAHLGNWEIDPHERWVSASREHWRIYDGVDGGAMKRTYDEIFTRIHPDDRETIRRALESIVEGEYHPLPEGREWRIVRPDGSVRTVKTFAVAERNAAGRIMRVHGTLQDVTDQKLAEAAVQRSERMYRSLFHNLPFAVWEVDWSEVLRSLRREGIRTSDEFVATLTPERMAKLIEQRRIIEINQRALSLLGAKDSAEFSEKVLPSISPQTRTAIAKLLAQLILGERTHATAEYQIVRADGSVADLEVVIAANPVAEGRVTNAVRDVTERNRITRELQRNAQLYRTLFQNLPIAVWETDWSETRDALRAHGIHTSDDFIRRLPEAEIARLLENRRILEVNEHALRLFGASDPKVFASRTWTAMKPEHRLRVSRVFAQVLLGECRSASTELQLVRPDAVVDIEVLFSINPAEPGRLTTAALDVTDHKRAEEALRQSESRYRLLFRHLPVAVWETDWSGALELWKEAGAATPEAAVAWLRGGDRTNEELASLRTLLEANQTAIEMARASDMKSFRTWTLRAVRVEDIDRVVPKIASVVLGLEKVVRIELQTERCDGTVMDLEMQLAAEEEHPGRIITTAIDVTERKRIEQELQQSHILLESAQAIAHTGSWEVDLDKDEIFGSAEYWNIVDGHDRGPRRRRLSEMLLHVPADERPAVVDALNDARSAFLNRSSRESPLEFHVTHDDGSVRTVRGRGVFDRTPDGAIRGYGALQDITEQRAAEEAAQRQREELMRADRMISLGILVSGVAHEINNPNHFIMLNVPLLRSAWNDLAPIVDEYAKLQGPLRIANLPWSEMRSELPQIIDEVGAGAERIRAIVSELRTFGRDQDRGPHKPTSVNDVVEGSLRLLSNHIRKATAAFAISLEPALPAVAANAQRLEQVVVNLVLNSCQALERRDAAIRVVTALDRTHDRVEIRVIDEGRGIAAGDLKKICDPFFTTKRAEGGMGLGLAVSDRIVQEHNGTLTFQSEPGRGTTAIVSLPALRE